MVNSVILDFKHVSKKFKTKSIIQNVSFNIQKGEIVGIIGDNGSGKSTIMKLIGKLTKPTEGEIDRYIEKKRIGFLIEEPAFYPELSGMDNIKYYTIQNSINDNTYLETLFDLFGLENFKSNKYSTYSLGMKKKLSLILALLNKPELLVLDEPFSGLDVTSLESVSRMLLKLAQENKVSILISSHQLNEIYFLCNRFIFINSGQIVGAISKTEWEQEKKRLGKYLFQTTEELEHTARSIEVSELVDKNNLVIDPMTNSLKIFDSDLTKLQHLINQVEVISEEPNLNDYYIFLKESKLL